MTQTLLPRLEILADKIVGEYAPVFQRAEIQDVMAEIVASRAMAKVNGIESSEYAVLSFVFAIGYVVGHEDAG